MNRNNSQYVLITPAHNESLFIEKVFQSVLSQTVLPRLWVIVNDNSSDLTAEIAGRYARTTDWIALLNVKDTFRAFPSKVYSFNTGYEYVEKTGVPYDFIGNLDADISFAPDYFEYLLDKFNHNPQLGVAGTDYVEGHFCSARDTKASRHHVNGQCQLFRRRCFEDIGGYKPIEFYGEDSFAVILARFQGWDTNSYGERLFVHHRPMGTKGGSSFAARFIQGRQDYLLGKTLLWQFLRTLYWTKNRPYFTGGIMLLLGYVWSLIRRDSIVLPQQVLKMYRCEQYQRIIPICKEIIGKIASKVTPD